MLMRGGKFPRTIHLIFVTLVSLLVYRAAAQRPNIPPPVSLAPPAVPSPAPPATPATPAAPAMQPVSTAQVSVPPGGVIVTTPTSTTNGTVNGPPSLDQCGGAISRMVGLFILEILFEFAFSLLRFLVLTERLDWDVMKLAIIRLVYTIFPVIPFNFSCLWWGSGPRGSCLAAHQSIKVIFTLLLFYCMWSCLDACFLIVQGREEDDDSDYYDYDSESSRRNWRRRRRRDDSDTTGTVSGDESSEPKLIEKIFPFLQR